MSDSSASSSSSSSSEKPKKRAKAAEIDRDITDAVDLAALCAKSGADDEFNAVTGREWTPEKQTALEGGVEWANEQIRKIKAARAGKKTRTREEEAARAELIPALDPIITGAKRTFTEGEGERELFGIGAAFATTTTARLYRFAIDSFKNLSPDDTTTPPTPAQYKLTGVKPAEITRLGELGQKYKDADFAQADAIRGATDLLAQLIQHMAGTLNPLRRDLQFAADQEWPARDPLNRGNRLAFGLPPNRPMTE
jgi:hypothetical protein